MPFILEKSELEYLPGLIKEYRSLVHLHELGLRSGVRTKGSSFLSAGYVYAPYIPLQVTPILSGANNT